MIKHTKDPTKIPHVWLKDSSDIIYLDDFYSVKNDKKLSKSEYKEICDTIGVN